MKLSYICHNPQRLPERLSEQEKRKIVTCSCILRMYMITIGNKGASEDTSIQLACRITELYEKYIKDVLKEGDSDDADFLLSVFGEVAEYVYGL